MQRRRQETPQPDAGRRRGEGVQASFHGSASPHRSARMISCETRSRISRACFRSRYWPHEKRPRSPTAAPRPNADPHKTVQGSGGHRHMCLLCTRIICLGALSTPRGGGCLRCVRGAGRVIPQPLHQPAAAAIPHGEEVNLSRRGRAAAPRSAKIRAENCSFMQRAARRPSATRDIPPVNIFVVHQHACELLLHSRLADPAAHRADVWVKMTLLNEQVEGFGFFFSPSQVGHVDF